MKENDGTHQFTASAAADDLKCVRGLGVLPDDFDKLSDVDASYELECAVADQTMQLETLRSAAWGLRQNLTIEERHAVADKMRAAAERKGTHLHMLETEMEVMIELGVIPLSDGSDASRPTSTEAAAIENALSHTIKKTWAHTGRG